MVDGGGQHREEASVQKKGSKQTKPKQPISQSKPSKTKKAAKTQENLSKATPKQHETYQNHGKTNLKPAPKIEKKNIKKTSLCWSSGAHNAFIVHALLTMWGGNLTPPRLQRPQETRQPPWCLIYVVQVFYTRHHNFWFLYMDGAEQHAWHKKSAWKVSTQAGKSDRLVAPVHNASSPRGRFQKTNSPWMSGYDSIGWFKTTVYVGLSCSMWFCVVMLFQHHGQSDFILVSSCLIVYKT